MSSASSYIHALEGRLRVKSASVKGSFQKAQEVEAHFREQGGIREVVANPVTGSMLFLYDSECVSQDEILENLRTLGCLPQNHTKQKHSALQPIQVTLRMPEEFGQNFIKTVVTSTVEVALQHLVFALI